MKSSRENCFAIAAPGLEGVCAAELKDLGVADARSVPGGVEFSGTLRDLYRANLWLRTASRVVVRLGAFRSSDFPDLFRRTVRLPWGKFIRPGAQIEVRATSHRSRLVHTGRLAETVTLAAERALGCPSKDGPEQLVLVRLEDDLCQISVDSSGELLHRRGYRLNSGPAPLRETLAAGILQLLGWKGDRPLFDPLCGSGTLVIEGALMARMRAPGRNRPFSFMQWPGWRPGLWDAVLQEAGQLAMDSAPSIRGSERDAGTLEAARRNAVAAGAAEDIELIQRELSDVVPTDGPGLLVCNPPYGGRISGGEDLRPFFALLGEVCRRFQGWQVAFLSPEEYLTRATGLSTTPLARLSNGGIPVTLQATSLEK